MTWWMILVRILWGYYRRWTTTFYELYEHCGWQIPPAASHPASVLGFMEPAGMRQRSVLHREGWAAAEEKRLYEYKRGEVARPAWCDSVSGIVNTAIVYVCIVTAILRPLFSLVETAPRQPRHANLEWVTESGSHGVPLSRLWWRRLSSAVSGQAAAPVPW